jgi:hypothetical protein
MRRRSLAILVAVYPLSVHGAGGPGFVRTDRGSLELTGPRSFFGVYRAAPPPAPVPARADAPPPRDAASPGVAPDRCRAERSAYVRQLLRATGVGVDDPLALLDALAGSRGSQGAQLFSIYGLLAGVDPIRPLAWDMDLRTLARELERCSRADR